ncbi:aldehyde dehydrogenase family protein [Nonomuraea thailandensis]
MARTGSGWRKSRIGHFIGGEWVAAGSGRTYPDHSPWSGEVLAEVAAGDADDAQRAITAAHEAFPGWSALPPWRRQQVFLRAADLLHARRGEVLDALAAETGCGRYFGEVQVDFALKLLRQAAQLAYQPTGSLLPSDVEGTQAMAVRRPVGVVGAIAPWNASSPCRDGPSSGLSPSATPWCSNPPRRPLHRRRPVGGGAARGRAAGRRARRGHPRPRRGRRRGRRDAGEPLVKRVNFTGSTPTGRRLAEKAGRHLKRVVLQLSGQNPLIVTRDADLTYAVNAATYGAFIHQGQVCMCARRIYVERPLAAEFTERFAAKVAALPTGDPHDPATVVGPVINEWALALLDRRVKEAVELGSRVLAGGVPQPPAIRPPC